MKTLAKWKWSKARPYFLGGLFFLILTQMVALSPKILEVASDSVSLAEPEEVLVATSPQAILAHNIPKDRIPDYTLEGFQFVSTKSGSPRWKVNAKRASLFNIDQDQLVHAQEVIAKIYNIDGTITQIQGKEAKYFLSKRDLEMFGDVTTTFPDGFRVKSAYIQYLTDTKFLKIPTQYEVEGDGLSSSKQESVQFTSLGLNYPVQKKEVELLERVKVITQGTNPNETTEIYSDHCLIKRLDKLALFTMLPTRPIPERFVQIKQPGLEARGRKVELIYEETKKKTQVKSFTAFQDVLIRDRSQDGSLRYGTGGKAIFEPKLDRITLKEFPQVYQNNDTVTGETIIVHRDTDIVEVEQSNAFSEGLETMPKSREPRQKL